MGLTARAWRRGDGPYQAAREVLRGNVARVRCYASRRIGGNRGRDRCETGSRPESRTLAHDRWLRFGLEFGRTPPARGWREFDEEGEAGDREPLEPLARGEENVEQEDRLLPVRCAVPRVQTLGIAAAVCRGRKIVQRSACVYLQGYCLSNCVCNDCQHPIDTGANACNNSRKHLSGRCVSPTTPRAKLLVYSRDTVTRFASQEIFYLRVIFPLYSFNYGSKDLKFYDFLKWCATMRRSNDDRSLARGFSRSCTISSILT